MTVFPKRTNRMVCTLAAGLLAAWMLAAGLLAACLPVTAGQQPELTLAPGNDTDLEECQLSAPGVSVRLSARCGSLAVYEDQESQSGRQIEIHFAVLLPVSQQPAPDPVFFLAGGPGQAASEAYLPVSAAFERIRHNRTIVLVDQRGAGKSHPLDCPSLQNIQPDLSQGEILPLVESCLAEIDADPRFYTTANAVKDLDQVRELLGYEAINLYGVSYGTRLALTYLQEYPDRVRTAILDGVVPQNKNLGETVAVDAQNALEKIFAHCEADPACGNQFPNVRGEFEQLWRSLQHAPAEAALIHPVSGEITTYTFTQAAFADAIRILTYAPETAAMLPLLIHSATTLGDLNLLAAQYLIVSDQVSTGISEALNYSVVCAEDLPFYSPEESARQNWDTYYGVKPVETLHEICRIWPHRPAAPGFKDPVRSNVPVLLLSGEFDPVTPPENAAEAAAGLPNSLSLVAPGQGHNIIFRGCLPQVAAEFVEKGDTAGLDAGCVDALKPAPFFLNFSGPGP